MSEDSIFLPIETNDKEAHGENEDPFLTVIKRVELFMYHQGNIHHFHRDELGNRIQSSAVVTTESSTGH